MGKKLVIKGADFSNVAVFTSNDITLVLDLIEELISMTSGGEVRYTTDGSTPTMLNSQEYSTPVDVSEVNTLRVAAVKNNEIAFTPKIDAELSIGSLTVTVALSSEVTGDIRYTVNGGTPTATSPVYSTPIPVSDTTTIYAALFSNGEMVSEVCEIKLN